MEEKGNELQDKHVDQVNINSKKQVTQKHLKQKSTFQE